jgi:hypothetical protein
VCACLRSNKMGLCCAGDDLARIPDATKFKCMPSTACIRHIPEEGSAAADQNFQFDEVRLRHALWRLDSTCPCRHRRVESNCHVVVVGAAFRCWMPSRTLPLRIAQRPRRSWRGL